MTNKSKIIKLEKKKNKLKFWYNWGGWILCVNALIPIILLMPCVIANISPVLAIAESLYLGFSVLASFEHELIGEKKIRQKIQNLDQDILQLVKTDKKEMNILREYDKIETLKKQINAKEREIKEQRQLVKELINEKNKEAKSQLNYVKELTKRNVKQAKEMAEKEVEEMLNVDDALNEIHLE